MAQAPVELDASGSASGLTSAFWIDFEDARRAVETIVDVAHDDPDERPTCIVLVGQSGMGKTSILREAQRRISDDFPIHTTITRRVTHRCCAP
jgi:DNA replication protein DnaC